MNKFRSIAHEIRIAQSTFCIRTKSAIFFSIQKRLDFFCEEVITKVVLILSKKIFFIHTVLLRLFEWH